MADLSKQEFEDEPKTSQEESHHCQEEKEEEEQSEEENKKEWTELMGTDLILKVEKGKESKNDDGDGGDGCPDIEDAVFFSFQAYQILPPNNNTAVETANLKSIPSTFIQSDPPLVTNSNCLIALGEGDVPPALEMATRFLSLHQRAIVRAKYKYAYGLFGRRRHQQQIQIPPKCNVEFHVQIERIVSSSSAEYSTTSFQMERALAKKQLGNDVYQWEWDGEDGSGKMKCLRLYGKAMELMANMLDDPKTNNSTNNDNNGDNEHNKIKKEATAILVDSINNIAAVHMRSKQYAKARESIANALKYDPNNFKALCRGAKAAMADPSISYQEADLAVAAAEEIAAATTTTTTATTTAVNEDHKSKIAEVKKLRSELDRKKREYRRREKDLYTKMMKSSESTSKPPTTSQTTSHSGDIVREEDHEESMELSQSTNESKAWQQAKIVIIAMTLFLLFLSIAYIKLTNSNNNNVVMNILNDPTPLSKEEF